MNIYLVDTQQGMKFYYNRVTATWHQNKNAATKYGTRTQAMTEMTALKRKSLGLHLSLEVGN